MPVQQYTPHTGLHAREKIEGRLLRVRLQDVHARFFCCQARPPFLHGDTHFRMRDLQPTLESCGFHQETRRAVRLRCQNLGILVHETHLEPRLREIFCAH